MKASLRVMIEERIGAVHPYIYGQYFEHLGNCIYPSVWDDQSPHADELGNRLDVIAAVKELAAPVVRWPGGCFADLYDWQDGVGPRTERPTRFNWHWPGIESNRFGTDEFVQWCKKAGTEPYVNVNLGTGTLVEALRWVDYCNGKGDTADSRRRMENGYEEPYNVKLWGIGNETWGNWEAGQLSGAEYAHKLANWAQFFKKYDSSLQLLGVGSDSGNDPDWDRQVVVKAGQYLHYLTFHLYGSSVDRVTGKEYYPVAFTPVYFERQLRKMIETIQSSMAIHKPGLKRPIQISMDEWNIRHYEPAADGSYQLNRNSLRNLQDAIFAAGVFNTMIRLSPSIGMANYVFLVNGNGVLSVTANQVVRTTLFHVFKQYAAWMTGQAVKVDIDAPVMRMPAPQVKNPALSKRLETIHEPSDAPVLDTVAVLREDGELAISIVNRHATDMAEVELHLPEQYRTVTVWTLTHEDIYAANTSEQPDRVTPVIAEQPGKTVTLPAHSITLVKCGF